MRILTVEELVAMAWTTTAVAILFTIGRFAIHWYIRRRLSWDDYLNGVAVLFLVGYTVTWQIIGPPVYQRQLFNMGIDDEKPQLPYSRDIINKIGTANSVIFWCVVYAVKASFLALYWNIFNVSTRFRIAWLVVAVYTFISFGITFMWSFWTCGSPKYAFNIEACSEADPQIVNRMLIAWCVLDIVGDLLLIALPIAMLKQLPVTKAQKFGLVGVFGLVAINIAFEILRTLYTLWVDLAIFPDQNTMWTFLQATTAVIVCALPCYGCFLQGKKRECTRILNAADSGPLKSPASSWTSVEKEDGRWIRSY